MRYTFDGPGVFTTGVEGVVEGLVVEGIGEVLSEDTAAAVDL